jgi:hypothetical protein
MWVVPFLFQWSDRYGSENVTFPSGGAVEMIHSLAENFKIRSTYFSSFATNKRTFYNPSFVEVSDATEKLQFELTQLLYNSNSA